MPRFLQTSKKSSLSLSLQSCQTDLEEEPVPVQHVHHHPVLDHCRAEAAGIHLISSHVLLQQPINRIPSSKAIFVFGEAMTDVSCF